METETEEAIYEIRVHGHLNDSWSDWFDSFTVTRQTEPDGNAITSLTGPVRDQSALQGVLTRLWNLNLTVLQVKRIGAPPEARSEV